METKNETQHELEQAQAHLERAVGHLKELGQLWATEGANLGKQALEATSDSLRKVAGALDEVKKKLG